MADNFYKARTAEECFKVLGMKPTQDLKEIKKAYRELAKKYQESMRNFVNDFGQPQFTEVFKTVDPKLANEIFKAYVDFNNSMINLINKLNK
mgnify:CR=1 FL=1